MKIRKRYKFIVMYQPIPKYVKEKQIDTKLERDIRKVAEQYGYRFIGSGYDFTNKRRDLEYEANH